MPLLEPDRDQIEIFVDAIFRHAQTGFVSLRAFVEGSNNIFRRTPIKIVKNNLRFLCDAALDDARRAAQNPKPVVFCPPLATFNNDKTATEDDIAEGLAITVECDEEPQAAQAKLEAILGPVTAVIRSGGVWSNGNGITQDKLHLHWRMAVPARSKEEQAKLKRAREICAHLVKADPTSIPICHPIRWAGSWHRKSTPRLTEIIACDPDIEIKLDEALALLEPLAPTPPPPSNRAAQPGGAWDELAGNILAGKKLHDSVARLAMKLLRGGTPEVMAVQTLRMLMDASQAPRDDRWEARYDDIPRAVTTAGRRLAREQAAAAAAAAAAPQPQPSPPPPPPPGAQQPGPQSGTPPPQQPPPPPPGTQPGAGPAAPGPQPSPQRLLLDATHATFKKWLGNGYDTAVLNVVLAAAAVERMVGDPLWPMVIGGSGNAKTETVQSLAGAGAIITSTITSEGALLAATARGRHATGGLLRKLGQRGVLVLKDMTSLLAMDMRARDLVLSALREVYDGKWERNVGVAGGRTLTWEGRITLVAACTTAWDTAHKVIAVMGERFVIVRADSAVGRGRSAMRAIGNTSQEIAMRTELKAAVNSLIAGMNTVGYRLTPIEIKQLVRLANIVSWVRTGVERDYRGEIVDAHALEMPTRFSKQLTQLVRGAVAIGLSSEEAMQLARRCAHDTIPPLRRRILLDVANNPTSRPREVARRIHRPRTTVRRELEALHVLGALVCEEKDEKRGYHEVVIAKYSLAPAIDRKLLLSL